MKKIMLLVLIFSMAAAAAACGGNTASTGGTANKSAEKQAGGNSAAKQQVSIATGGVAGSWYAVGSGLANVINKTESSISVSVEQTNGGLENVRLVGSGSSQFSFASSDAAYYGFNGNGPLEKDGKLNILGLFQIMDSSKMGIFVLANSDVKSIKDFKGKKVVVGPPATSSLLMGQELLKAAGIDEKKDIKALYLSYAEGANALRNGTADVLFAMTGHPVPDVMDLATTKDIRVIPIDDDIQKKMLEKTKFYTKAVVKAETYKGQKQDVSSVGLPSIIIANKSVSDQAAYDFTKAVFEHLDEVHKFHSAAQSASLQTAPEIPLPMHPGAKKYFEEKGIKISN